MLVEKWIMLVENIKKYCMSKHKACEEYPFGDVPICYKLNGKIFAQIYPYPEDELLNMIDHAYDTVLNSFSKKVQKQIMEET